jgi:hypothetical protein
VADGQARSGVIGPGDDVGLRVVCRAGMGGVNGRRGPRPAQFPARRGTDHDLGSGQAGGGADQEVHVIEVGFLEVARVRVRCGGVVADGRGQ